MFNYTMFNESKLEYLELMPADDLANGERFFVDIGDKSVVVFNIAGKFFAIDDVCTHDGGPLGEGKLEGFSVTCPRHGAEFDVRTGKAVKLPAVEDVAAYPVQVRDGTIFIGMPKE